MSLESSLVPSLHSSDLGSTVGTDIYKMQISSRAALPQTYQPQASYPGKQVQQEMQIDIYKACKDLVFRWANVRCSTVTSPSVLEAGEYSLTLKAALRIGSTVYPISFSSGRTATVAPDAILESLPLNVSIPNNTTAYLRWFIEFSTAPVNWPLGTRYNTNPGWQEFGTSLTDIVDSNTPRYTAGTNMAVLPPYQITGKTARKLAFEIMGDSASADGSNDSFAYNTGWSQKGLHAAQIPFVTNGASGNSLAIQIESWGSTAAQQARRKLVRANGAISHVLCGLCTNDFASGATDAQVLARLATLKTQMDAIGVKVIPVTSMPRTNPANNAKYSADSVNLWTYRRNFNDAIRANNGVGYGYFDSALYTQDPGNIDLWRTDLGTPTSDGIHPSSAVHSAMSNAFQTFLSQLN